MNLYFQNLWQCMLISLFFERTQISDEELTQILEDISKEIGTMVQTATEQKEVIESEGAMSGVQSNRMRNLQKKLDQIDALKERVKKGEKLEVNQVTDQWNFGADAGAVPRFLGEGGCNEFLESKWGEDEMKSDEMTS